MCKTVLYLGKYRKPDKKRHEFKIHLKSDSSNFVVRRQMETISYTSQKYDQKNLQ